MRMPNPRAAFQDKVVGGGVGRGCTGGGAGKRAIRAAAMRGGNQPGHGGGPRSPTLGSRWRPGAPGSPGLLGLCSTSNGSESTGGCLQSSPVGTSPGDHLATRCHHVGLRLPLPLPGKHGPQGVCVHGGGVVVSLRHNLLTWAVSLRGSVARWASLMSVICTVPALPGTPLHRPSAGPRLHGPVGHWIPAAGATACACLGHLPPPLPAPPPGRLPGTLQPSPLQAPARPTAEANPGLTGVPGCSHTGKGLGLRCLKSRILSTVLMVAQGLKQAQEYSALPCSFPLPESGPGIPWMEQHHLGPNAGEIAPENIILHVWAGPWTAFPAQHE